jgi:hypothetical protein
LYGYLVRIDLIAQSTGLIPASSVDFDERPASHGCRRSPCCTIGGHSRASLGIATATDLAAHLSSQGRSAEAHALLQPVFEQYTGSEECRTRAGNIAIEL